MVADLGPITWMPVSIYVPGLKAMDEELPSLYELHANRCSRVNFIFWD